MRARFPVTDRTRVRRVAERGRYDRDLVYAILDEALVCHVGFATEDGPFVVPTIHARAGDDLILHGSTASRTLRSLGAGTEVCVTVTLLDGLVLARSAFHHSMNYRSVMVFGVAAGIDDPEEKLEAMRGLTERIAPGRWDEIRGPDDREFRSTRMLRLPLAEASAKVRTGPPADDDEDMALDVWAGVIPITTVYGSPEPDPQLRPRIPLPGYLQGYRRG